MTNDEYINLKTLLVRGCLPERRELLEMMTPKRRAEFAKGLTLAPSDYSVADTWRMLAIMLAQDSLEQIEWMARMLDVIHRLDPRAEMEQLEAQEAATI